MHTDPELYDNNLMNHGKKFHMARGEYSIPICILHGDVPFDIPTAADGAVTDCAYSDSQ